MHRWHPSGGHGRCGRRPVCVCVCVCVCVGMWVCVSDWGHAKVNTIIDTHRSHKLPHLSPTSTSTSTTPHTHRHTHTHTHTHLLRLQPALLQDLEVGISGQAQNKPLNEVKRDGEILQQRRENNRSNVQAKEGGGAWVCVCVCMCGCM
jgi:hypothetical protein